MSRPNIEILLSEWGAWKRGENRSVLGYPDQAAFGRMRVDGQRRTDPDVMLVDDDMSRVDRHINSLFPEAKRVIIAHYVWPGPTKAKLDRLQVSKTAYYANLDYGHKQLGHWMGAGYDIEQNYFVQTSCESVRTES